MLSFKTHAHSHPDTDRLLLVLHRALGFAQLAGAVPAYDTRADYGGCVRIQQAASNPIPRTGVGGGGGKYYETALVCGSCGTSFDGGREEQAS